MQVCIEDETIAEERIFLRERLFDLDHHVDKMPYICGIIDQGRTGIHVLVIGKTGADAGAFFHIDVVSCGNIGPDVVRCQTDTEFIVLDLFYTSDLHKSTPHNPNPDFRPKENGQLSFIVP